MAARRSQVVVKSGIKIGILFVFSFFYLFLFYAASNSDVIAGGKGQCSDPVIQLACIMETDACPAICKDNGNNNNNNNNGSQVKAGDLDVAVTDYTTTVTSVPRLGTIIFNKIAFNASQAITVNSVTLEKEGLFDRNIVQNIWFERDGVAVSNKGRLSIDGQAIINFTRGLEVKSIETLDLVVELSGITIGSEVAFNITNVDSSAKNISLKGKTSTYRTADYEVARLKFRQSGGTGTEYKLGSQSEYTFGQFTIENYNMGSNGVLDTRDVSLRSITLRNNGKGTEISNLFKASEVKLLRNGENVAKSVIINGRDLTIAFSDTIAGGKSAVYTLVANIAYLDQESEVQFSLNRNSDLVAYETKTNFRTFNEGTTTDFALPRYTIKGGKVVFANNSSFPTSIDAGSGASDVVIASGTLTVSEAVTLGTLTLYAPGIRKDADIRALSLEVDGRSYQAVQSLSGSDGVIFTFDKMYVRSTSPVILRASIASTVNTGTIKIVNPQNLSQYIQGGDIGTFANNGEYNNQETLKAGEIAGMIRIATINVQTPKFSLRNTKSTNQKVLIGNADYKTVFDGEITAANGNVSLSEVIVTGNVIGLTGSTVEVALFFDGVQIGSSQSARNLVGNNTFVLNFTSGLGTVTNSIKKVELRTSAQGSATGTVYFEVVAKGTETVNGNPAESSKVTSSNLEVVGQANISVSSTNKTSKLVVDNGGTIDLATFDITAQNGDVTATQVIVSGDFQSLSGKDVTIWIGDKDFTAKALNTGVIFTNINPQLKVGANSVRLTTRPNSTLTTAPNGLKVTIDTVTVTAPDAVNSPIQGSLGTKYLIVRGLPAVTLISKTAAQPELKVRVTYSDGPANSSIILSGLTVDQVSSVGVSNNGTVTISGSTATIANGGSINRGSSVDITLSVNKTSGATLVGKLTGIEYILNDGGDEYVYDYTDVYQGDWSNLTHSW